MKVKSFAQQTASGRRPDGKPCPPFKIIVLDEADSMTKDAQGGGDSTGLVRPEKQPYYRPKNQPEVPFGNRTFQFWTTWAGFQGLFTMQVPFLIQ